MWDCPKCGCLRIAASLAACPMCGRERNMPKATVSSGASNADAVEGESGYVAPEAAEVTPEALAEPPATVTAATRPEPVQAVSAAPKPTVKAAAGKRM